MKYALMLLMAFAVNVANADDDDDDRGNRRWRRSGQWSQWQPVQRQQQGYQTRYWTEQRGNVTYYHWSTTPIQQGQCACEPAAQPQGVVKFPATLPVDKPATAAKPVISDPIPVPLISAPPPPVEAPEAPEVAQPAPPAPAAPAIEPLVSDAPETNAGDIETAPAAPDSETAPDAPE